MDLKDSDRLKLRVFAIASRLKEVSAEVSQARGEAHEIRQQIEEMTVSSLMEGQPTPDDVNSLKARLDERVESAERNELEEVRLKGVLFNARRDHLRQLKQEKPGRWIILE
jgi:hypothetical protein